MRPPKNESLEEILTELELSRTAILRWWIITMSILVGSYISAAIPFFSLR